jgi:hypothetical protein
MNQAAGGGLSVSFADENRGVAVGLVGIYRTTDSGLTWLRLAQPVGSFYGVSLVPDGSGFALGSSGRIYRTTDAGITWLQQQSAATGILLSVSVVSSTTAVIVGSYGVIMRTNTAGVITSVEPPGNGVHVPRGYLLEQNYPNPFNPSTTIRFSLDRKVYASLSVYNILGQLVATLVAGELDAGMHEAHWDATGLTSGIYFYQLVAGQHVESKKMVLLK